MSGFFFAFALFLWTLVSDASAGKIPASPTIQTIDSMEILALGSTLELLPLIPWVSSMSFKKSCIPCHTRDGIEIIQLKYWVFCLH